MKSTMMLFIMLVVLLVSGCAASSDVATERADEAALNKGDIVIGVAWPFASRGDLFEEGIDLAVEEINSNGGVLGSQIRLIKVDDQSSVTRGLSVAQQFANHREMIAVIGHRSSTVTIPAAAIYDHAGLVMLTPASTAPKLTELGYQKVIRSIPNDQQIGQQMAEYARNQGYEKIAIFYTDDAYGRGLANAFEDHAGKNGLQIIDRLSSYSDLNDLQRISEMWTTLNVEAVFLADVMPDGAKFIADLRQTGLDVPIIGGDGLDSNDLLQVSGKAAEGTVVASVFNPNASGEETVNFVNVFTTRYDIAPNKWAAQGYDAVYLLAQAMKTAGSRVPAEIANALKTMEWVGVTGEYAFDQQGEVVNKPIVKKIFQDGHFEYLDERGN